MSFLFFVITVFCLLAFSTFGPTVFNLWHGLPIAAGLIAVSCYQFSSMAGIALGGLVGTRFGRPGRTACVCLSLAAALTCFLFIQGLGAPGVFALMILIALCNGVVSPSRDMLIRQAAPKAALGRAYGFVYAGYDIGSVLAPPLYGYLLDHKFPQWVLVLVVLSFVVNASIALWLDRSLEKRAQGV